MTVDARVASKVLTKAVVTRVTADHQVVELQFLRDEVSKFAAWEAAQLARAVTDDGCWVARHAQNWRYVWVKYRRAERVQSTGG